MKIDRSSILFNEAQILTIENTRSWKYVCETCIKNSIGWINQPFAIFWSEEAHPQGSNYAALFYNAQDQLLVTDGISATEEFTGVVALDGNVYYSRYRNDFRNIPGGFIDGGRDYIRRGGDICQAEQVSLKIIGPTLNIIRNGEVVSNLLQLEYK